MAWGRGPIELVAMVIRPSLLFSMLAPAPASRRGIGKLDVADPQLWQSLSQHVPRQLATPLDRLKYAGGRWGSVTFVTKNSVAEVAGSEL